MSDAIVERTRTEVSVEEVTERRYRCAVCDMVYDPEDVVNVGLDRQKEAALLQAGSEPRAERIVCAHCVEGLFEYRPDDDSVFAESASPVGSDWASVLGALGALALFLLIPVSIGGAVAFAVGGEVVGVVFAAAVFLVGTMVGTMF